MKKLIFLPAVICLWISCKKEHNCFCNTTIIYPPGQGQNYFVSNNKKFDKKMSKKQAKAACDHEALNINTTYENFWTNNGNWSANGTIFSTQCSVQ